MDSPSPSPPPPLAEAIAAAQAWWRDAGVDLAYSDEPHGWLAELAGNDEAVPAPPRPAPVAEEPVTRPLVGGDRAAWPQDLAAFRQWWLDEPTLDHGGTNSRIGPRGDAGAPVMIVVPMPEEGDRDHLLQGAQGRLLGSLAAAMGLTEDAVYLASALPRHTPLPDWGALAAGGYGDVLLHHIALADPARLIVFGRDVLSLLKHDPAQAAPLVSQIAIQGRQLPLLASYVPSRLLGNARWRAQFWRSWLDWTEGDIA
jgi:uracil-DNA glycosylase